MIIELILTALNTVTVLGVYTTVGDCVAAQSTIQTTVDTIVDCRVVSRAVGPAADHAHTAKIDQ